MRPSEMPEGLAGSSTSKIMTSGRVIAFTGPSRQLTAEECSYVQEQIASFGFVALFKTGAAWGVDTEACVAAMRHHPDSKHEVIVPQAPHNEAIVAIAEMLGATITMAPGSADKARAYMRRNELLVAPPTTELHAFPESTVEEQRSGTWATIRRARNADVRVILHPLTKAKT